MSHQPAFPLRDKFAEYLIHRSLRSQNEPLSTQFVLRDWRRVSHHLGISRSNTRALIEYLDAWVKGDLSYYRAESEVKSFVDLCLRSSMRSREMFALRQAISSFGFFSSSAPLLHHGVQLLVDDRRRSSSVRDLRRQLRGALILGNLDIFRQQSDRLRKTISKETSTDKKLLHLGALLTNASRKFEVPQVAVIGPSEVDEEALNSFPNVDQARILIPTENPDFEKPACGDPKVVFYANGETTDWLAALPVEQLSHFSSPEVFVRTKKRLPSSTVIPSTEEIIRSRDLFLTGNPNLVPMVILDLLLRGFTRIYVTGANFWFGAVAYREDQRRFRPEIETSTDSYGSTGASFERCQGLANHDQIVNRSIIRTMVSANLVSGDEGFLRAVNAPESEYLRHLDLVYGHDRR